MLRRDTGFRMFTQICGPCGASQRTRLGTYEVHKGQVFVPDISAVPFLDVLATVMSDSGDMGLW
jgi:hypothetical protein